MTRQRDCDLRVDEYTALDQGLSTISVAAKLNTATVRNIIVLVGIYAR